MFSLLRPLGLGAHQGGHATTRLIRRVLRRVLETAFKKVLRRVLRRCLAVVFEGERVLRRVLRRGSEKGLPRRHFEFQKHTFLEYDPVGVHPFEWERVRRLC